MKKLFLFALLLTFLMMGLSGCTTAAPLATDNEFADPYMPTMIWQTDGTMINTQLSAYVRKHEVLVPLSVVTDYLKSDYVVETDGAGLYFNIASPPFAMETPRLTEFLKDGVDFRLGATTVFGVPHVNLKGLEKLLNISIARSADGQNLVISQAAVSPINKPSVNKKTSCAQGAVQTNRKNQPGVGSFSRRAGRSGARRTNCRTDSDFSDLVCGDGRSGHGGQQGRLEICAGCA